MKFLLRKPRQNVLEIGSAEGGSFYLWCRLFSGKKISVDQPEANFGGIGLRRAQKRNREFKSWSPNVTAVLADSHALRTRERVAKALGDEQVDFLFIDGDHTLAGVRHDYFIYGSSSDPADTSPSTISTTARGIEKLTARLGSFGRS